MNFFLNNSLSARLFDSVVVGRCFFIAKSVMFILAVEAYFIIITDSLSLVFLNLVYFLCLTLCSPHLWIDTKTSGTVHLNSISCDVMYLARSNNLNMTDSVSTKI